MKEYLEKARRKAGKREAVILAILFLAVGCFVYETWHVNKLKASSELPKQQETKKENYSPKTASIQTDQLQKNKQGTEIHNRKDSNLEKKKTTQHPIKKVRNAIDKTKTEKPNSSNRPPSTAKNHAVQEPKKIKNKLANLPVKQTAPTPKVKPEKTKDNPTTAQKKVVYLTFDDGPSQVSGKIMDELNKYHAKATFFMLKPNILRFSDDVKRMVKEGHSLGLHGVTHDPKKIYRSKETVVKEMNADNEALYKVTGKNTSLIRTPYGSFPYMKPDYKQAVKEQGYRLWDWTIDSRDWFFRSPKFVASSIEQLKKMETRNQPDVILMHERKETLESLPVLLQYLQKNGFELKRIEQDMKPVTFHPVE